MSKSTRGPTRGPKYHTFAFTPLPYPLIPWVSERQRRHSSTDRRIGGGEDMDAGSPALRIGVARRWSEIYGAAWVVFGDGSGDDPASQIGGKEKMNGYLDLFLLRPVEWDYGGPNLPTPEQSSSNPPPSAESPSSHPCSSLMDKCETCLPKFDGHVALLFGVPRSVLFSWDSAEGYIKTNCDDTFRQKISVCCFSCSVIVWQGYAHSWNLQFSVTNILHRRVSWTIKTNNDSLVSSRE
jgi:hypothetical protein